MKIGLIGIILSVPLSMTARTQEVVQNAEIKAVLQPISLTQTTRTLSYREQKLLPICAYYIRSYLAQRPNNSVFLAMNLYNLEKQIAQTLALPEDISQLFGSSFYKIDLQNTAAITTYIRNTVASYKMFRQCTIAFAKIYYLLKYIEFAINDGWDINMLPYECFDESILLILGKEACSLNFKSPLMQRITYTFDESLNLSTPSPQSFGVLGDILYMLDENLQLYSQIEQFIFKFFGDTNGEYYRRFDTRSALSTELKTDSTVTASSLENGSST
jgi:hypothetical protein